MRKLLGVLFSLFLLAGSLGFAQVANEPVKKDFVFEIPRMDLVKTLPVFKDQIKTNTLIEFAGFCESRSLMMLKMPQTDLTKVIKILDNMGLTYYIKEHATVDQAISTCEYKEEIELSKVSH